MKTLITSCNRRDLLEQTIESLFKNQKVELNITLHEDHPNMISLAGSGIILTGGIGQHASIEKYLNGITDKYYLHCEDDWLFKNHYDWITESKCIMEEDDLVIKVMARNNSPHPCKFNIGLVDENRDLISYGEIHPWTGDDGICWHGFSWNPGITRADILKRFMPFPKFEQELAERIFKAGYKVAALANPVYTHIGEGRSTVHLDPTKK